MDLREYVQLHGIKLHIVEHHGPRDDSPEKDEWTLKLTNSDGRSIEFPFFKHPENPDEPDPTNEDHAVEMLDDLLCGARDWTNAKGIFEDYEAEFDTNAPATWAEVKERHENFNRLGWFTRYLATFLGGEKELDYVMWEVERVDI
jgi:hypothetical protein